MAAQPARTIVHRRRRIAPGRGARGIAEIVGTLMLILIVVAAAIALAAFVAGYESQYLAEQASAHDKSLENVQVISIDPVVGSTPGQYASVSTILGSLDVQNTTVQEITLNGQPIAAYSETPLGSANTLTVCLLCAAPGTVTDFQLAPEEQVSLSFNLQIWNAVTNPTGGLFSAYTLPFDEYVDVGVYTLLGNEFARAFYAPTAVIQLSETNEFNGAGNPEVPMLVLDGEGSQPGPNATAVWWEWTFTPMTPTLSSAFPSPPLGEEVLVAQADFPTCVPPNLSPTCPETYNVTLTVQDSDGLFGTSSVGYDGFEE